MKKNIEERVNGFCLYTPGGAAREYAAVGCNLYRGCPYQCRYCYNRRGMTAKVMGVDHAVLLDKFSNSNNRPLRYCHLTGEEYAYSRFLQDLSKWKEQLRKKGIFFSFSTDPLCDDCFNLTWKCVISAVVDHGIPVKVLTKSGCLTSQQMVQIEMIPMEHRKFIAFGFTLTGCDDWETFAPKNNDRITLMRSLHEKGYKTFASIEPIVDFESSFGMIQKTLTFCDQYLIGLMSSRKANGLNPYSSDECWHFIQRVVDICKGVTYVYWKDSVRKLMADDAIAMSVIQEGASSTSVCHDWSLFSVTGKE